MHFVPGIVLVHDPPSKLKISNFYISRGDDDLEIQTRPRKVLPSYVQSFRNYRVDKQTNNKEILLKTSISLCCYVGANVVYTHTNNTTVLLLCWNLSGTTRVSRYQKGKNNKGKTNLDLLEQKIASGSGICWAICNAYSLRPPASLPLQATHMFTSHSTHPQSSSLHGAVKARSLSEIEKRTLPPPCFPIFNFQSTRSQGATLALLPPVLT